MVDISKPFELIARHHEFAQDLQVIRETNYRVKGRLEFWPYPNTSTTWFRRGVSLYWNWVVLNPRTQAGILIHEATHEKQCDAKGITGAAWWAYYLANMNRLEAEAGARQQAFLNKVPALY